MKPISLRAPGEARKAAKADNSADVAAITTEPLSVKLVKDSADWNCAKVEMPPERKSKRTFCGNVAEEKSTTPVRTSIVVKPLEITLPEASFSVSLSAFKRSARFAAVASNAKRMFSALEIALVSTNSARLSCVPTFLSATLTTNWSTPAPASPLKRIAVASAADIVMISSAAVAIPVTSTLSSTIPAMDLVPRLAMVVTAETPERENTASPLLL